MKRAKTNRTKKASADDENDNAERLVPWAVKLTADLKDDEKTALKNIRRQGTPEFQAAALVLQNIVERSAAHVKEKTTKSKPGPKKSVNPTDDDIATLLSCIRMILDLPHNENVPSTLIKLKGVLQAAHSYLRQNLLLRTKEANCNRLNLIHDGHVKSTLSFLHDSEVAYEPLKEVESKGDLWPCVCANLPLAKATDSRAGRRKRSGIMNDLFVELARVLEIEKAHFLASNQVTVDRDPETGDLHHMEFPDFNSLKDIKLGRKELLWTALGRIVRLKSLFYETTFVWKPRNAEGLWSDISYTAEPNRFGWSRSTPDNEGIIARALKGTIVAAAVRQGPNPFSEFGPEVASGFATKLAPGVIVDEPSH
jgi:hypothetical protein